MAERFPSSLRSVKSARSLRRRSGTFGKNVHEDTPESDTARVPSRSSTRASSSSVVSGKSHRMPTVAEDGDVSSSGPRSRAFRHVSTVEDAPLPPLPRPSPNPANDRFLDTDNLSHYERYDDHPKLFSDVPLTPALRSPDLERDGNSSRFSSHLPTPDFSRQNSIHSRISISRTAKQPGSTTLRTRTNDWKSEAETLADNRPSLMPAPSSNWTQKWPKPRLNPRSLGGLVAAIEESEGLGFDKPDRWTTHKWVLLMSILIAFGYSSVGLAYAMVTWFGGKYIYIIFPRASFLTLGRLETRRGHVHRRQRHLGLHHRRVIYPRFHMLGRALRCYSEFSAHPGRLLSVALALFHFAGSRRLRELQTNGICAGQEAESGVEPMVQWPGQTRNPDITQMLWVLQSSASSHIQQKVFSEDDTTGLQSETVPIREAKPEDDLVHHVLPCSSAGPRYLHITAMFEPRHGNVREGDHAKEV